MSKYWNCVHEYYVKQVNCFIVGLLCTIHNYKPPSVMDISEVMARIADLFSSSCFSNSCFTELAFALD